MVNCSSRSRTRGRACRPRTANEIFEPFFRNQMARKSHVPGHGLGLAICQSNVLAHGGRIEVTDRPGSGACFSVFLPAPVQAGTRQEVASATSRSFRNRPLYCGAVVA
ncbi:MAG: hypothetical protein E6I75_24000 [Chloroflexi bacterium]|nr:MAG: hypothetical protein E6I75_24000 [Chloroflexota bacterium]